ncbi:hypothetical protein [Embleya sp. AB8]|uniref:winged helix-turn-helix domain-containing protein n=1 Tax=Embleya sp. AB8 TaxID=3156304 RepID=UPI003C7899D3
MLRMSMDAAALGRTRFAISPLHTAVDLLRLLCTGARGGTASRRAMVAEVVRDRRLTLLAALFGEPCDYVPDFVKPEPPTYESPIQDELHAVATVDAARLRTEIGIMVRGNPTENLMGRPVPGELLDLLECGEHAVSERMAAELHRLWQVTVGPQWTTLRARMEADLAHRAETITREGITAGLAGLHPRVTWHEDHVRVLSRFHCDIPGTTRLVLVPSAFNPDLRVTVDSVPLGAAERRQPMLTYPVRRGPDADGAESPPTRALLGATRARLLLDLQTPRSTAELAERHYLAASTVSYHLGILYRFGLVTRTRSRHHTLYLRPDLQNPPSVHRSRPPDLTAHRADRPVRDPNGRRVVVRAGSDACPRHRPRHHGPAVEREAETLHPRRRPTPSRSRRFS